MSTSETHGLYCIEIVEPVQGTRLRHSDGSKLWFPVLLRNFQASMSLYTNQAAELSCSTQLDAVDFWEVHSTRRKIMFPHNRFSERAAQKKDGGNVAFYVVECVEQDQTVLLRQKRWNCWICSRNRWKRGVLNSLLTHFNQFCSWIVMYPRSILRQCATCSEHWNGNALVESGFGIRSDLKLNHL